MTTGGKPNAAAIKRAYRDARRNRRAWDADSKGYQAEHGDELAGDKAMAWGLWRIPEASLEILGEIRGKDVLELGCGGGQWSIALIEAGARPVGLDISANQLSHARHLSDEAGVRLPLVEGAAEGLPFRDESFDSSSATTAR